MLGHTFVEPITPGPSRRFSEIFRPARFFKLRKREISGKFKSFCRFCLFSVDKPHQPAKHRRQLTYQDPSFQWLMVLLLGVEKLRIKLEFFGCFCQETFTRIVTFLFVYAWAIFRQTIPPKLSELSEKTTTIDYFSDNVKFLLKFSVGAILLASDEFSDYFTGFVDFANFTT